MVYIYNYLTRGYLATPLYCQLFPEQPLRFISSSHAHAWGSVSIRTGFLPGQSYNQTSARIDIERRTIRIASLMTKTGFRRRTSLAVIALFRRIGVRYDPVGLHMGLHLLHLSPEFRALFRTARGPYGKKLKCYINAWPNFTMETYC